MIPSCIKSAKDKQKLKEVGQNASRDLYISWKDCSDQLINKLTSIVEERRNKTNIDSVQQEQKIEEV